MAARLPIKGTSPVISPDGYSYAINWAVVSTSSDTASTSNAITTSLRHVNHDASFTFGDLEEAWYDGIACQMADRRMLNKGDVYCLPDGSQLVIDEDGGYKILDDGAKLVHTAQPDREYKMPDGSYIRVDKLGNYTVEDKDAKVIYKANRIRDFSPHLNASNMVAKFVEYVGSLKIDPGEILNLPIELFINWLVIEAAERDQDPIPEGVVPITQHDRLKRVLHPQCMSCGRFICRNSNIPFCNVDHGLRYVKRLEQQGTLLQSL